MQEWRTVFQRFFARPEGEEGAGRAGAEGAEGDPTEKFAEGEIDSMREQKLRELDEYRRQVALDQQQVRKSRAAALTHSRRQSTAAGGGSKRASAVRRSSVF